MLIILNCVKYKVNNQPGWFRCLSITCSGQPISIVDADPNIQRQCTHNTILITVNDILGDFESRMEE